jgi:hypothetical protein
MAERQAPQSFVASDALELVFDVDQVITGMTVRFAARRNADTSAVLTTEGATPTATASVTDTQECTIVVASDDTEDLVGTYKYAVEVEDGSGEKSEIGWGFITFKPSIIDEPPAP